MKKIFTLLFLSFLLFNATNAWAAYDFTYNGLYFKVISLEDKTCMLVDRQNYYDDGNSWLVNSSYSGNIVVPEIAKINDKEFSVIKIGYGAFYRANIQSISLPNSIIEIQSHAFYGCTCRTIKLPDGLKTIGNWAFGNSNIQAINIPDAVQYIGDRAFKGCAKLKSLKLSKGLKQIGDEAFAEIFANSGSVIIPNNCEGLWNEAFYCANFKELKIEDGRNPIEMLKRAITCAADKIYLGREVSLPYGYLPFNCIEFETGDLVETVSEYIGLDESLEVMNLGLNTKKLNLYLNQAENIKKIRVKATQPPKSREFAHKVYINAILYVPKGCKDIYSSSEPWCNFLDIEEMSE